MKLKLEKETSSAKGIKVVRQIFLINEFPLQRVWFSKDDWTYCKIIA